MAAKVLKGEKTCAEMPYETVSEYGIYINSEALTQMSITVPQEVAAKAVEAKNA